MNKYYSSFLGGAEWRGKEWILLFDSLLVVSIREYRLPHLFPSVFLLFFKNLLEWRYSCCTLLRVFFLFSCFNPVASIVTLSLLVFRRSSSSSLSCGGGRGRGLVRDVILCEMAILYRTTFSRHLLSVLLVPVKVDPVSRRTTVTTTSSEFPVRNILWPRVFFWLNSWQKNPQEKLQSEIRFR